MRNRIIMAVLALTLIFGMTTGASSEMFIGGQFGPSFNSSMDVTVNGSGINDSVMAMKARTGFTSGLVVGYDFVSFGTGAMSYPDWMRFFGVMMDVSYTQMNFSAQNRALSNGFIFASPSVDGSNTALTFLFTGKLPFCADTTYPGGRFAPYVGVGPTLLFTSMDFTNLGGNQASSTNVGLVVEAGMKYMVTPAFSAELAYRYRYAQSSINTTLPGAGNVNLSGPMNNSQIIGRLAYHF